MTGSDRSVAAMTPAKPDFSKQPLLEKLSKARVLLDAVKHDSSLTPDSKLMFELELAVEGLKIAYDKTQGARRQLTESTTLMDMREGSLDVLLDQLHDCLERDTPPNAAARKSEVFAAIAAPHGIQAPTALVATAGDDDGSIDVVWNRVRGAESYVVEQCEGSVTGNWVSAGASKRSLYTRFGLLSGTRYWFRVAGVAGGVQGPWSDPVTKIAP
jgi:hypothetical protein